MEGVAAWSVEDPLYERLVGPNQWPSEAERPTQTRMDPSINGLCEVECPGFRVAMEVQWALSLTSHEPPTNQSKPLINHPIRHV